MSLLDQARRQGEDSVRLNSMIVLSILLHALLLFVALFSPSLPTQQRTFVPAYTVDLVAMPAAAGETRTTGVPFGEEVAISERETSIAARRPVDAVPAAPIERIQVRRRDANGELDEALRQIQERVAAATRSGSAAPTAPSEPAQPSPDAAADRMNVYYSALWVRIKEQWALPEAILSGQHLEAVLAVTIRRDGSMNRLGFEERSGNRLFDESVESAVRKAAPFPALPGWMSDSSIDVGIRFRSSDY